MIPIERILEVRVGPPGLPGLAWRAPLYLTAEVTKSSGKDPNEARLELYNLAPQSLAWLEQPGQVVQVLAGEGWPSLVFSGDIPRRGVRTELKGQDQVTTLEAGDGRHAYRDARFVRSYPPGTTSALVLADLFVALGVVVGFVAPLPPLVYPSGVAFAGRARDALDEVVSSLGGAWSIQDGILELTLAGQPTPGQAVVVSSATGMQGSPQRTDKGVSVTTKLEPALKPGRVVSVVSRFVTGFYRVTKVAHKADSRGLTWQTQVEGVPL